MAMVVRLCSAVGFALLCMGCSTTGGKNSDPVMHLRLPHSRPGDETRVAVVRVTTDAHEKTVAAVLIQSTGSADLDLSSVEDAKTGWHGPVSSTQDLTIRYEPAPNG